MFKLIHFITLNVRSTGGNVFRRVCQQGIVLSMMHWKPHALHRPSSDEGGEEGLEGTGRT